MNRIIFQKKIAILKSKHEILKNLSIEESYKKARKSIFEQYKNSLKDSGFKESIYF